MNDFFTNLFKKNEEQPKVQPRVFYKRDEDDRIELMHRLDNKVKDCDRRINLFIEEIAKIDEQIKNTKQKYDRYQNKKSQQAVLLENEGGRLLGEKQKLQARIQGYQQQKANIAITRDNLTSIVDVEEMNELTKLSTEHIQKAVGKIDLYSAQTSASDARKASKTTAQLSAYIINPYDIDLEESTTANAAAFASLNFDTEEFIEDEEIFLPSVSKITAPITNKAKPMVQSLLDEDYS